jgi:mevalonate kinase
VFQASAPGSIMLMGEHAVLRGHLGLATAIDRHITVTLTPRKDDRVLIDSDLLGQYQSSLHTLTPCTPFTFVLQAIHFYQTKIQQGFTLHIASTFSDKVGLGSSAAVTLATHYVLRQWLRLSLAPRDLFFAAKNTIRTQQGRASGTDVAASLFGGVISYQETPHQITQLIGTLPLVLLYSGYKTPTPEVIQKVDTLEKTRPDFFEILFEKINQQTKAGIFAIQTLNHEALGIAMRAQQTHLNSLEVNDATLSSLLTSLQQCPTILGEKISGSGLGDCVVGVGNFPSHQNRISIRVNTTGLSSTTAEHLHAAT